MALDSIDSLRSTLEQHGISGDSLQVFPDSPDGIHVMTARPGEAVGIWRRLRSVAGETGCWPIILGSEEDLDLLSENLEMMEDDETEDDEEDDGEQVAGEDDDQYSLSGILRRAIQTDPRSWFQRQPRASKGVLGEWPANADERRARIPAGSEAVEDGRFAIPRNAMVVGEGVVYVALLPTANHWEAPAYLRFGGFNDSPQPHEHASIWRYWHDSYGVELVGISHDVVEAVVSRPPATREDAMKLALEQYAYCSDIVSQGCGTVSALAAALLNSSLWYFWWD